MNKSLCMLMTALILGMVSCPDVLAAQDDAALSGRVRKVDTASASADSSRVRSVQSGNHADYGSRVRKAQTEEVPAVAEETRVRPVTGDVSATPERVSDPTTGAAAGENVAYGTSATEAPAASDGPALLSESPEKIKTVKYPNSKLPVSRALICLWAASIMIILINWKAWVTSSPCCTVPVRIPAWIWPAGPWKPKKG